MMITSILLWVTVIALGLLLVYCGSENRIDFLVGIGGVILVIVVFWGAGAVGTLGESLEKAKYNKSSTNQLTTAESPVWTTPTKAQLKETFGQPRP